MWNVRKMTTCFGPFPLKLGHHQVKHSRQRGAYRAYNSMHRTKTSIAKRSRLSQAGSRVMMMG
jgi:hypothetical protein